MGKPKKAKRTVYGGGSIIKRVGRNGDVTYQIKWFDAAGVRQTQGGFLDEQTARDVRALHVGEARENRLKVKMGIAPTPAPTPVPLKAQLCGDLIAAWRKTLNNRSADDDRSRIKHHLLPYFARRLISDVSLRVVLEWIDQQRNTVAEPRTGRGRRPADGKLSDATIRHNLNLLSRFFAWAIERELATVNPVRQIPQGRRPRQTQKRDQPWLDDEALVRTLLTKLPEPVRSMFYLGNRSGLRVGEAAGLRLADLGFLGEGVIRVRYTYDGAPLKEDKRGEGKCKWVPASDDAAVFLASTINARLAAGAGPEDLLFPNKRGRALSALAIERVWNETTGRAERSDRPRKTEEEEQPRPVLCDLTFYQATRHSFVSRSLAAGASLDEVSAAVGHHSPTVTRRFYDHYIRKQFSPLLRAGLGFTSSTAPADVVPIRRRDGAALPSVGTMLGRSGSETGHSAGDSQDKPAGAPVAVSPAK